MQCIDNNNEFNSKSMEEKKQQYLKNMIVTREEVIKVMNYPQRSKEWLKARSCRLTASNMGSAAGHNPRCQPRNLLMNSLWDTFKGNICTEYGTKNEPVAAKVYENFMKKSLKSTDKVSFYYPGLIICEKYPWLAVSPDGLTTLNNIRFLLEIKCPFSKKFYPHIPHYYYDQIQSIMAILQLPYCDFVVWTYDKTQIKRYNFDPEYWKKVLFPRLENYFMNEYLPRLILKDEGKLQKGELEPTIHINITPKDNIKSEPVFDFIWEDPAPNPSKKRKIDK